MADPLVAETGRRIRALREARGLSQEELAERAELTMVSVSRAERGVTEITIVNLARICAALGTNLAAFFEKARKPVIKRARPSPGTERIVALLKCRDPRQVRWAAGILKAALKEWRSTR